MAIGQFDPAVEVLAELKAAGKRCFALSNMEAGYFGVRRQRFGFMRLFDGCVISGIEGLAKPDQRIFQVLLRRYDLDVAPVWFGVDKFSIHAIGGVS